MKFYTNVQKYGDVILHRGYDGGKRFSERVKFEPKLYIETNKETKFRSIHDKPLEEIKFSSLYKANDFINKYSGIDNFKYYGMDRWVYQFIGEYYWNKIEYDFDLLRIIFFDIETDTEGFFATPEAADQPITSIAMKLKDTMIVLGLKDYQNTNKDVKYYKFKDEASMLESFVNIFAKYDPDIISGWYSDGYDVPYIVNRCNIVLGKHKTNKLSPWGVIKPKEVPLGYGKTRKTYDIYGISHIDYMDAYMKFSGKKPESYKLDQIAHDELGDGKIDYSEYGSLNRLYRENHQKFIDYNIKDTDILPRLDKKLKLMALIVLIAYMSKTNFIDSFKNTRVWDSLIYNYLKERNVVIDAVFERDESKIAGGFVKDPVAGLYSWNVSIDGTSLYPLTGIITGNVSPDTFVEKLEVDVDDIIRHGNPFKEYLKENNLQMTGNGSVFRRDKRGFLSIMIEDMFNLRKEYKNKMLDSDKKANEYLQEIQRRGLKV